MAVTQPSLDMPELLWKNYIDLEIAEGEGAAVRCSIVQFDDILYHVVQSSVML